MWINSDAFLPFLLSCRDGSLENLIPMGDFKFEMEFVYFAIQIPFLTDYLQQSFVKKTPGVF